MINPLELRIGNLFWEDYGGYKTVTTIDAEHDTVSGKGIGFKISGKFSCSDIYPVLLTPDILEKCGFIYKSEFYTTGKDLISFIFNEGKLQKTFVFIDMEFRQIRYLHELQNLYFALTGEELEIKELL